MLHVFKRVQTEGMMTVQSHPKSLILAQS